MEPIRIKVGSRSSKLSLIQTSLVTDAITKAAKGVEFDIISIKTLNEKIDRSKYTDTDKSLYTKEIDEALLKGDIDIAVHSLKDVKNDIPDGLQTSAVIKREDPRDILISRFRSISDIENGATIGTSSIRRAAQLLYANNRIEVKELHGNVDSRILKFQNNEYDGIVLALAGVKRLGQNIDYAVLGINEMVPAIGQGAIAVQSRYGDKRINSILEMINDPATYMEVTAERAFGARIGADCNMPVAANARLVGEKISIIGMISDRLGKHLMKKEYSGHKNEYASIGGHLAEAMLREGGERILNELA
jgi:hydroxymethylbilane synthase